MVERVWTVRRCQFQEGELEEDIILEERKEVHEVELGSVVPNMLARVVDETTYVIIMLGD